MKILLLLISIMFISCEEKIWEKPHMFKISTEFGKGNWKFVMPTGMDDIIPCDRYGKGCLSVHRAKYKTIQLIYIEMDSEENARESAKRINAWYSHNWVFDDVSGEPLLERFVQNAYKAVKPEANPKSGAQK